MTQEAELGLNPQVSSGLLGVVWQRASAMGRAVVWGISHAWSRVCKCDSGLMPSPHFSGKPSVQLGWWGSSLPPHSVLAPGGATLGPVLLTPLTALPSPLPSLPGERGAQGWGCLGIIQITSG